MPSLRSLANRLRGRGPAIPPSWHDSDWESKARENPLYAVMTTAEMRDAPADDFDPAHLELFFDRGRSLWNKHLEPRLAEVGSGSTKPLVVEYGCGAGRVLRAAVDAGHRCSGIDVSATMLGHCRRLVPGVESLHLVSDDGRTSLADECADLVFSYAVLQHISRLSIYLAALDEMSRLVKPGGVLAVQVNCTDFRSGSFDDPERTENFENYSLHHATGTTNPTRKANDNWSGVYVGWELLCARLREGGVSVRDRYFHNPAKPQAIWAVGDKT